MKLQGRGILITGASHGLGEAIARSCIAEGADIFICARDANGLEKARDGLVSRAKDGQKVFVQPADVSNPDDVNRLIDSAGQRLPCLDGLVNNAGVYGPIGRTEDVDWQEWVRAVEVNLNGTVLPCREAVPVFRVQGYGKIVNLSGGGATKALPRFSAYATSKAAVVRFTENLAEEVRGTGIDVNAIAPGALNTRLLDQVLAADPECVGKSFYDSAMEQKKKGGVSLEVGAALCVFLLSHESDGITGRLLSAVWDPWKGLPEKLAELTESDIYTLRRIVPEDRGLNW